MPVTIYGETNVGKMRTNNEDSFIAEPIWGGMHYLAVVIDGVGGYEGGEVAAKIAHDKIKEYLLTDAKGEPGTLLKEAVVHANEAIYSERQNNRKYRQMCCVLTACIIDAAKQQVYMAHVGDTRLYVYNGGGLKKLSHDHSLVGYREEIGDLTEEEAMNHPQRNVINRDVGSALHKADEEDFIESAVFPMEGDSYYLLCSDGLNDMITSREITRCLTDDGTVREKCSSLINAALDAGGRDNITVVLAHIAPAIKEEDTETVEAVAPKEKAVEPVPVAEPVSQQTAPVETAPAPSTKPARKRRSGAVLFVWLLVGVVLGGAGSYFALTYGKFLQPNLVAPPVKDPVAPVYSEADSLYKQLAEAQRVRKDTFSFAVKGQVIKIDRPLVIYANNFVWKQPDLLRIEPADSATCPVGLIVRGSDFKPKNILFSHFEKDTIVIRNNKPGKRPQDR